MLNSTDLRNIMRDEEYGPMFAGFLFLMKRMADVARLDAQSKDIERRMDALIYLAEMGLPVEVKRPAKRSHKGWR